jgi:predicted nucleic acid-binding protein
LTALIDTSVLIEGVTPEISESWVVSAISVGELEAGVLLAPDGTTCALRLRVLSSSETGCLFGPVAGLGGRPWAAASGLIVQTGG